MISKKKSKLKRALIGALILALSSASLYAPTRKAFYNRYREAQAVITCEFNNKQINHDTKLLEEKYDIDIRGNYPKDSSMLAFILEQYRRSDIEGLKICYIPTGKDNRQGFYFSDRIFINTDNFDGIEGTTIHETSHIIIDRLGKRFRDEWIQMMKKHGKFYKHDTNVDIFTNNDTWKKTMPLDPRYGFMRPYGARNFKEDAATFAEIIHTQGLSKGGGLVISSCGELLHLFGAPMIFEDHDLYLEKARLLKKYGLLTNDKADGFIDWVQKSTFYRYRNDKYFNSLQPAIFSAVKRFNDCARENPYPRTGASKETWEKYQSCCDIFGKDMESIANMANRKTYHNNSESPWPCSESDEGKNYFSPGDIQATPYSELQSDSCMDAANQRVYRCGSHDHGCYLKELYCKAPSVIGVEYHYCNGGCANGGCAVFLNAGESWTNPFFTHDKQK